MTFSHYSAEENNETVGQSEIQSKKGANSSTDNMKLYKLHDAWILKRQIDSLCGALPRDDLRMHKCINA